MGKKLCTLLLLVSILLNTQSITNGQDTNDPDEEPVTVFRFDMDEKILPGVWRKLEKAMNEAKAMEADYFFIRMDTYGGLVNIADSIRTALLESDMTTIVWIDNNAASAGALISIACDSIYMNQGANMGAATVVNQEGKKVPDKYQSYMRSTMRSTANATGRDPRIAEAMVDASIHVPGVSDSGKTLTFTTSEAIANDYCEGKAESVDEVMKQVGIPDYSMTRYQASWIENAIGWLTNPAVTSVLLLLILGGIYFELQTPGLGFPIAASFTAALLYFAPLYLEGLAENWEILVFLLGILLMALEIFVIPGFGIAGVSGLILLIGSLMLALVRNIGFDFTYTTNDDLLLAFIQVGGVMAVAMLGMLFFGRNILRTSFFQQMVLTDTQQGEAGYRVQETSFQSLIGEEGVAATFLRPSGKVEIDDERYSATTDGEFIDKGEKVKVVKAYRSELIVRKK